MGVQIASHVHYVQMNINKFVVYTRFLEAVKGLIHQYNVLLLSVAYSDPVFFID